MTDTDNLSSGCVDVARYVFFPIKETEEISSVGVIKFWLITERNAIGVLPANQK